MPMLTLHISGHSPLRTATSWGVSPTFVASSIALYSSAELSCLWLCIVRFVLVMVFLLLLSLFLLLLHLLMLMLFCLPSSFAVVYR